MPPSAYNMEDEWAEYLHILLIPGLPSQAHVEAGLQTCWTKHSETSSLEIPSGGLSHVATGTHKVVHSDCDSKLAHAVLGSSGQHSREGCKDALTLTSSGSTLSERCLRCAIKSWAFVWALRVRLWKVFNTWRVITVHGFSQVTSQRPTCMS